MEKIYRYDPLLTVIKLATVKFHRVGTKLAFYGNEIDVQPPSWTQGTTRYIYNNSKNDLSQLFTPIRQCIDIYLVNDDNVHVKQILMSCVDGLKILQKTYCENINILIILQFLIDMITDVLGGINKDHKLLLDCVEYKTVDYIDELWPELSINVLASQLSKCTKAFKESDKKSFVDYKKKLDDFIKAKENKYSELLTDII